MNEIRTGVSTHDTSPTPSGWWALALLTGILSGCGAPPDAQEEGLETGPELGVKESTVLGGTLGGGVGAVEFATRSGVCTGSLVGRRMISEANAQPGPA